jgi:hypothetical protein
MRGSTRVGMLAISVVCMFAFTASAAFADEDDQLLDKAGGTGLRDVTAGPKNQPDALEFVNNGNVELGGIAGLESPIVCKEAEFGTTVLRAKATATLPVEVALPFGVAEGDECTSKAGGLTIKVPTYFDTLASGAIGNAANGKVAAATIADTGPDTAAAVTLHNLKFSQNIGGKFCVANLDGIVGHAANVTEGLVEEKPPNLNMHVTEVKVPIASGEGSTGCPTEGKLTANFFLETPSTTTDTAFFEATPPEWFVAGEALKTKRIIEDLAAPALPHATEFISYENIARTKVYFIVSCTKAAFTGAAYIHATDEGRLEFLSYSVCKVEDVKGSGIPEPKCEVTKALTEVLNLSLASDTEINITSNVSPRLMKITIANNGTEKCPVAAAYVANTTAGHETLKYNAATLDEERKIHFISVNTEDVELEGGTGEGPYLTIQGNSVELALKSGEQWSAK